MPVVPLDDAVEVVRSALLAPVDLRRAVASGRRRGLTTRWRRVEFRPVELKTGLHLQVIAYDERQAHTVNHPYSTEAARTAVAEHLSDGFAHWHVDTVEAEIAIRVTKKGTAILHRGTRATPTVVDLGERLAHDRVKPRLLPEDAAVWRALGITDGLGRIKPTRRDKHRQVEDFLRLLAPTVDDAIAGGHITEPTEQRPLRIVDLGCGSAYLTLATYAYLSGVRGFPVEITGVDRSASARKRTTEAVAVLGWQAAVRFAEGSIAEASVQTDWPTADPANPDRVDVVLALHACDTATDDALAWGVQRAVPVILSAPCCHHDVQRQLRDNRHEVAGWVTTLRQGILRERLGDVLTDTFRAQILRLVGYRVDVVEFVGSEHTPRNIMIRGVRTGAPPRPDDVRDFRDLAAQWSIQPALVSRLDVPLRESAEVVTDHR